MSGDKTTGDCWLETEVSSVAATFSASEATGAMEVRGCAVGELIADGTVEGLKGDAEKDSE
jgi:hypothetical protein